MLVRIYFGVYHFLPLCCIYKAVFVERATNTEAAYTRKNKPNRRPRESTKPPLPAKKHRIDACVLPLLTGFSIASPKKHSSILPLHPNNNIPTTRPALTLHNNHISVSHKHVSSISANLLASPEDGRCLPGQPIPPPRPLPPSLPPLALHYEAHCNDQRVCNATFFIRLASRPPPSPPGIMQQFVARYGTQVDKKATK